jgi:GNAT superfamily N-acetyltransferase
MKIVYTDGENEEFVRLCGMLDEYLDEIVGGKKQREQYDKFNTLEKIHDVFLIYIDGIPVGCASFKRYDETTAEVKRVFLHPEYRGQGLSKHLMNALEEKALRDGFSRLILETGDLLVEATGLYKKIGFEIIENYEPYKDMKGSVCMRKKII